MMDFLHSIQQSGFCQWVRESDSIFSYSGILLLHTVGMGFVVGINACIDLLMLWFGFWLNAITGTVLLAIDVVDKLANVDFYVKMVFIALAVINLRMLRTDVFR